MRPWALAGLLLLASAFYVLLVQDEPLPAEVAARTLSTLGEDLDRFARGNAWRYPPSLEELVAGGFAPGALAQRDPWGRPYVYELHPRDATRCRLYTLGEDARADDRHGTSDVVLYKIRSRTLWKHALGDVPPEWSTPGK